MQLLSNKYASMITIIIIIIVLCYVNHYELDSFPGIIIIIIAIIVIIMELEQQW
jgi:hypothetical protein